MNYDTFKIKVFNIICDTSRSIITMYLRKLAEDFNIGYNIVEYEFNVHTNWRWNIDE